MTAGQCSRQEPFADPCRVLAVGVYRQVCGGGRSSAEVEVIDGRTIANLSNSIFGSDSVKIRNSAKHNRRSEISPTRIAPSACSEQATNFRNPCPLWVISGHCCLSSERQLLLESGRQLRAVLMSAKCANSGHRSARVHRTERWSSLLTDRACSTRFFNLLFNGGHIETGTALHRWEIDERLRRLRYLLLDENETPELVGEPVVIGD
jgi:hypothetical protein